MPADERRIITILFSDIVGSTSIAERLDPEEWREIVESVHKLAGEVVLRHSGKVLQYLGDGFLAVFGADLASERDPERAILAALEIVHKAPELPTQPHVALRAGVHTGLVVLGDLGGKAKREFTASGDAMNLAQRLQSLAEPSNVVISHECYRYVRGLFDIIKGETLSVKGRKGKVQPYIVIGRKKRPYRMVARGVGGVKTATIGRTTEMARLNKQLQDVLVHDRLIWSQIIAGPGLGKTRMLGDLTESLDLITDDLCLLRSQALEGDLNHPYAAIRRLWFDRFQIAEDAPAADAETFWMQQMTTLLGTDLQVDALALGMLLGLAFTEHPSIGILLGQPGNIKPMAITASQALLGAIRREKPLILLLEDMQWADASSWTYLTQLFLGEEKKLTNSKGTLVLATARPEWTPPSQLLRHRAYQQLTLEPLSGGDCRKLVIELLQRSEPLPDAVVDLIVQRTEGIPYYAEEMINWFIDRGILDHRQDPWRYKAEHLNEDMLPDTLHHLLSTRLNALSDVHRQTLQLGAVFGRNFWQGGLVALGSTAGDEHLEGLEQRGFIQARATSSLSNEHEWRFHHNLMQLVSYESVLKRRRPAHHLAAAGWLEQRARESDRLAEFTGMLGRHFEFAGENGTAVDWYLQHDHVMNLVGEVELRRKALDHTLDLVSMNGSPQKLAEVQFHRGSFFENLGDYPAALTSCEQAVAAAEQSGDRRLQGMAQALMVVSFTRMGQYAEAERLSEATLSGLGDIDDDAARARILTNIAIFYTEYGDLGKGVELTKEQIEINHRTGERYGEAIGSSNLGYLYLQLGLFAESREALERAIMLSTELEARRMRAYALLNLGLVQCRSGDPVGGQKVIQEQAWPEFDATQDPFGMGTASLYLGICQEACEDLITAATSYRAAYERLGEINIPGSTMDALAGLVRCELETGHVDPACEKNDELWAFLRKEGAGGLEFPILAYQTCGRVFERCGEQEKAEIAWKEGYEELMTRAEKISDDLWRRSFLENIPEHREMHDFSTLCDI